MAKPNLVKCKYCKKEIDKSLALIVKAEKSNKYFCNEECKNKYEQEHSKNNKPVDKYRQPLLNYIYQLYANENYPINYPMLFKQIKDIQNEVAYYDRGATHLFKTAGMLMCLHYTFDILKVKFEPMYGVIWYIKRYYNEARLDYIETKRIEKMVNEFEFVDEVKIINKFINNVNNFNEF
jgi:hypothetical protein